MKFVKRAILRRTVLRVSVAAILYASSAIASMSYACDPLSVQDEYIVVFEKTATAPEIDAAFADAAQLNGGPFKREYRHTINGFVLRGGDAAISEFSRKYAAVLRSEKMRVYRFNAIKRTVWLSDQARSELDKLFHPTSCAWVGRLMVEVATFGLSTRAWI